MDVDVQRADQEVIEHAPVLRHAGAIPRVVADGGWPAAAEHRCPGRAEPDTFCGRGSGGGRTQPRKLETQPLGIDARSRLDLDLTPAELTGDLIAQIGCGAR